MRNIFTNNSNPGDNKKALKKLPCKQIILFATSCARSVLDIFEEKHPNDNRPRLAIETAEKFAASYAAWSAVNAAWSAALSAAYSANDAAYAAYSAAYSARSDAASDASDAASDAAWSAANAAAYAAYSANAVNAVSVNHSTNNSKEKWDWIYNLYNVAYNNGKLFPQSWKTETTINLAKTIIETRNFSIMPILADALEDVGCNDIDILNHLRNNKDLWALSDWTLFNLGY